jgi:aromatic ring-cleaving dioxygenase
MSLRIIREIRDQAFIKINRFIYLSHPETQAGLSVKTCLFVIHFRNEQAATIVTWLASNNLQR